MNLRLNTTSGGKGSPRRRACRVASFRTLAIVAGAGMFVAPSALAGGVRELGGIERSRQPEAIAIVERSQPGASSESSYAFSTSDNGRTVKIEMKNGVVTHAEIDGKTIPDNRIERDGDTIRLKGDNGETLYEHSMSMPDVPDVPDIASFAPMAPRALTLGKPGRGAFAISSKSNPFAYASGQPATPPPVMVGIQMATPDSSLRGHLGLKEGSCTMLSAVHEGLPASKAGLSPYDIIVSIDGKDDASPDAIRAALKDRKAGDTVKLGVIQKGVRKDVTLTVDAYDRKRLDEAKVNAIAGNATWNSLDPNAWAATIDKNLINGLTGAGLDEDQLQDIIARIRVGQQDWRGGPFVHIYPDGTHGARALIDAERAAGQAREEAMAAAGDAAKAREKVLRDRNAQLEDMRRQMDELHKMMERMMNEKLPQPDPQEQNAPPPREGRS